VKPVVAFVLVAVTALLVAAASQADVVTNTTVPVSGVTMNPCNGEDVAFTGALHDVLRENVAADGSTHFGVHANFRAHGVGATTGAQYEVLVSENDADNEGVIAGGQGAAEETLVVTAEFVAQGDVPNFTVEAVEHITIAPDGTITSYHVDIRTSCPVV
jgi:hypothetical protein